MNLQDLKNKKPEELLKQATKLEIENPSSLRKQDLMFAILKQIATDGEVITGSGVIEIMQDGFGFLRSPEANYLAGADDIYISPNTVRKYGLRTGDSVDGEILSVFAFTSTSCKESQSKHVARARFPLRAVAGC